MGPSVTRVLEIPSRYKAALIRQSRELVADPRPLVRLVLTLFLSLPVALLIGVPTAGVGIGLGIGLLITAAVAWYTQTQARRAAAEYERRLADAELNSDRRVSLVTRQYEWAVHDVANLRDALRHSHAARSEADARAQRRSEQIVKLERQLYAAQQAGVLAAPETVGESPAAQSESAVELVWNAYEEASLSWLRVSSLEVPIAQVRVRDPEGAVIGISARALDPQPGEPVAFVLRIPESFAQALARREATPYSLEALRGTRWVQVELRSGESRLLESSEVPTAVTDKRGRVYRNEGAPVGDLRARLA